MLAAYRYKSLLRRCPKEQGKWLLFCSSSMGSLNRGMRGKITTNSNKDGGGFCDFLHKCTYFTINSE